MNPPFNKDTSNFQWLLGQLADIVNILIFAVFAVTLAVLIWQIINAWIINGGDSTKVSEGKKTIFIGFIALIIMSAVWGIIALLRASLFF